ncbi:hypothetical protein TVAG_315200 [Trichomonas vaginalis G3]|uniref:Uncharacterized protein n=1 Tax=Trichomonas vaginalis (strain ATCC PRA-98 / G3) TaxID=412133 RepID=A2FDI9_TRIV3|nr:hypothetical protein TVAGG3_0572030 [Trichomonas vaginalis G3]EAX97018.1 hypothetical protein TVAG_315200 [Trichomonas vaginalis G3]KAI5521971.1 hypothetical protein TVAGG3_0572030 [Trichomonas vaginalis G3]|eukprot:XP_001309948.1 hypothetical protein [Trichomonas vaginalis G3]
MSYNNLKRNYIRRKKYLNDSYETIKHTLELIRLAGKLDLSDSELQKMAMKHAQAIEAACWSPHLRLTAKEYEDITVHKTKDLCYALTQKYIPPIVAQTLKQQLPRQPMPPQPAPQEQPDQGQQTIMSPKAIQPSPSFPIPIAINRPQTPHAFPIPIVPKSAPSALPPLFSDDLLMDDGTDRPEKLDFIPSFDNPVNPFEDSIDDLPFDDDPIGKSLDLSIGSYDGQYDRMHSFE